MSRYLYEHFGNGNVTRTWIVDGARGNLMTLSEMRRILRHDYLGLDGGHFDNDFYTLASQILENAHVATHDKQAQLNAVHEWVINSVAYVNDPSGENQTLERPDFVLKRRYAACTGLTMLEALLLALVGFDVGFEAARYSTDADGYEHVYGYAIVSSGRIYFDPTAYNKPLGWTQTGAAETASIDVTDESKMGNFQIQGFLDFLGTAVSVVGGAFGLPGIGAPISALGHKQDADKAQDRAIAGSLDQLAHQVVQVFAQTANEMVENGGQGVTTASLNNAQAAYKQLSDAVAANPTSSFQKLWETPAYKAAFESQLAQFAKSAAENLANAATANNAGGVNLTGTPAPFSATAASLGISPAALYIGGGLFGLLIFTKIFSR